MQRRALASISGEPLPGFNQLLRVVPVAQTQIHHDVAITLLSAEVYRDGVVLILRVQGDVTGHPEAESPTPWLAPEVATSTGQRAVARLMSGGGSDGRGRLECRLTFGLALPDDHDLFPLEVTVPRLDLDRFDPTARSFIDLGHIEGPWEFRVPLS